MKRPLPFALSLAVLCTALGLAFAGHAQTTAPAEGIVEPVTVHATAHFDFDRTTVLPTDQQTLLSEVAAMKDVTWRTVSAEGHADNVGSAAYNQRLSLKRAQAVRRYLIGKGLSPSMVSTAGAGATKPIADNGSADGRAQNRRTDVTFEGVRPVVASSR